MHSTKPIHIIKNKINLKHFDKLLAFASNSQYKVGKLIVINRKMTRYLELSYLPVASMDTTYMKWNHSQTNVCTSIYGETFGERNSCWKLKLLGKIDQHHQATTTAGTKQTNSNERKKNGRKNAKNFPT